jgi:hypothetical protein
MLAAPILAAMMTGPAIAALICAFAFEKKGRAARRSGFTSSRTSGGCWRGSFQS